MLYNVTCGLASAMSVRQQAVIDEIIDKVCGKEIKIKTTVHGCIKDPYYILQSKEATLHEHFQSKILPWIYNFDLTELKDGNYEQKHFSANHANKRELWKIWQASGSECLL